LFNKDRTRQDWRCNDGRTCKARCINGLESAHLKAITDDKNAHHHHTTGADGDVRSVNELRHWTEETLISTTAGEKVLYITLRKEKF